MSVEDFSFSFGAVLLFAALLGGGLQISGYVLPKFKSKVRIAVGFFGVVFLGVGLLLRLGIFPIKSEPTKLISFSIFDDLGPNQIGEEINIYLDGEHKGKLHVDGERTNSPLKIQTKPGKHDYRFDGVGVFKTDNGNQNVKIIGQGTLDIQDEDKLKFSNATFYKFELVANADLVHFIEIGKKTLPENSILNQVNSFSLTKINKSEFDLQYDATVFNYNEQDIQCKMLTEVVQERNGMILGAIASKVEDVFVSAKGNKDVSGILEMKKIPSMPSDVKVNPRIIVTCDFNE